MTSIIDRHRPQIEALCRTYRVRRLDAFGSAVREDFDPVRSDVDFLVEFELASDLNTFHAYMGLRDELSRLLERPVDLVDASRSDTEGCRNECDVGVFARPGIC